MDLVDFEGFSGSTFAIIKPRAVKDKKIGEIITEIEKNGFTIKRLETRMLTHKEASELYIEHKDTKKYNGLIQRMTSGKCVIMWLTLEETCNQPAYKVWRTLIGATDPLLAEDGTLRHKFGISVRHNAVHGADSIDSVKRELNIFFK